MIYYTADPHFGHEAIIRFCHRPFADVEEMNRVLMENWNSVVQAEDEVYLLGDVFFKGRPEQILPRLNGKKHLIIGNHDRRHLQKGNFNRHFESIQEYLCIDDNGRRVVLFHYPIYEWDGFFRGSYHLYGHVHNSEVNRIMLRQERAFNAGVDLNDFTPQTLDSLIRRKPFLLEQFCPVFPE